MRFAWLVLLGTLAACGAKPSPRAAAAAALVRTYTPDLRLGEAIRVSRRKHPALALAPALGYRDSSYQAADGFADLVVVLEGMPTTPTVSPAQGTRSLAIQLSTRSQESARAAEARLRSALGQPQEGCRTTRTEGPSRTLYWRHEDGGVALMVPVGPWQVISPTGRGSQRPTATPRYAMLVFTRLDPSSFLTSPERCPPLEPVRPTPRRRR